MYSCYRMTAQWSLVLLFNILQAHNAFFSVDGSESEDIQKLAFPGGAGESHGDSSHSKVPTLSSNKSVCQIDETRTKLCQDKALQPSQIREKRKTCTL